MIQYLKYWLSEAAKRFINYMHVDDIIYAILKPLNHEIIHGDYNKSLMVLSSLSSEPTGTCLHKNTILTPPSYDLKIILPVYNVEKYVLPCIESILNQKTHYSFILCIIDDGSTDKSAELVDQYKNDSRVSIIHQKNKGLSGARNVGLITIESEYVCFVDSDDLMAPDFIEKFLDEAKSANADIIEGGCFKLVGNQFYIHHLYYKKKYIDNAMELTGFFWGKLFKSRLFEEMCFPEGYWYEDTNGLILFPQAKTIVTIPDIGYYYRTNIKSITYTAKKSPKVIDTVWVTKRVVEDAMKISNSLPDTFVESILHQFIVNYKRTANLTTEEKQSIFVVSKELLKLLTTSKVNAGRHKALFIAMMADDYGLYKLYMETH